MTVHSVTLSDRGLGLRANRNGSPGGRRQRPQGPRRVEDGMGPHCLSHHRGRGAPSSHRGLNKVQYELIDIQGVPWGCALPFVNNKSSLTLKSRYTKTQLLVKCQQKVVRNHTGTPCVCP